MDKKMLTGILRTGNTGEEILKILDTIPDLVADMTSEEVEETSKEEQETIPAA